MNSSVPGNLRPEASLADLKAAMNDLQRRLADWEANQSRTQSDGKRATGPTAFIVMPFGPESLQWVYEKTIKPTLKKCGVLSVRGDDMFGSNAVVEDVLASINDADLVIADLTGQSANVFYEIGIAHAKDTPVLLLAQSLDDVPFDLRHRRILIYEFSPPGVEALAENLAKHVMHLLKTSKLGVP